MRASNHPHHLAVGGALLVALGISAPVAAQPAPAVPTVANYCRLEAANEKPPNDAAPDLLRPVVVYGRFTPLIERNEWGTIGRALADDFRTSTAAVPPDMREKFQRQLEAMKDDLRKVEESPDPADFVSKAKGVRQVRFQIDQSATAPQTYQIFKGTTDEITITPAVGLAVARELCYRAHAAQKILVRYGQNGREHTVTVLGYYVTLWDNYNKQGYSQFPWELYLNGLWTVKEGQWLPPRAQWVIAHPAVAIETTWPQTHDLRRLDIITFEAIGYLSYTKDRKSYRGASLLVTLSASSDAGYGGLVHLGRIGKVGYVYHRRDDVTRKARHGAVFSVDLYKMIGGVPQKLQDAKARLEALRDSFK